MKPLLKGFINIISLQCWILYRYEQEHVQHRTMDMINNSVDDITFYQPSDLRNDYPHHSVGEWRHLQNDQQHSHHLGTSGDSPLLCGSVLWDKAMQSRYVTTLQLMWCHPSGINILQMASTSRTSSRKWQKNIPLWLLKTCRIENWPHAINEHSYRLNITN